MKLTTLVLLIIAGGCTAAAVYLGRELDATRQQLAQSEQARASDAARIRQLEEEQWLSATAVAAPASRNSAASSPVPAVAPPPQAVARDVDTAAIPPPFRRRDAIDETPAARNMRRLQSEVRLRRMYADMPAALKLDANQADQLFNLMADSQTNLGDELRASGGDPETRRNLQDAALEQREQAIEALLGPAKAAEFHAFEQSVPARMQVNQIGESLAAANVPLSDAQRSSLIDALISERQMSPPPARDDIRTPDDPDFQARFLEWQADYSARVQTRVEPLLTPAQLAQYRDVVEAQNARRERARARAERGRPSATR